MLHARERTLLSPPSHEMAVIREICDRVAVLENGRLVELGEVWRVFGAPQADATRALLASLVHDLPDDVQRRIVAEPDSSATPALLDIRLDGVSGRDPQLAQLAQVLGADLQLVHGGVERIQGRAQGRLVVAFQPQDLMRQVSQLAAALALPAANIRLLGYLQHD